MEAAHFAIRDYSEVNRYYHRKAAGTHKVVAIKAIRHKLARASYYIMRDQVEYDPDKLFHYEVGKQNRDWGWLRTIRFDW